MLILLQCLIIKPSSCRQRIVTINEDSTNVLYLHLFAREDKSVP